MFVLLTSCFSLTECSSQPHNIPYPWLSHHQNPNHWSPFPSQVHVQGPNSVYGGQDISSYSFTSSGKGFSSYQRVTMKFPHTMQTHPRPQKPIHKPQKPLLVTPVQPTTIRPTTTTRMRAINKHSHL